MFSTREAKNKRRRHIILNLHDLQVTTPRYKVILINIVLIAIHKIDFNVNYLHHTFIKLVVYNTNA